MKTAILKWWHKRRGYHCGPAILRKSPFTCYNAMIVQRCSCGAELETKAYIDAQQSFVPYQYQWGA